MSCKIDILKHSVHPAKYIEGLYLNFLYILCNSTSLSQMKSDEPLISLITSYEYGIEFLLENLL